MGNWQWVLLVLCLVGIFKEFRPSEPFVTEFLIDFHEFPKDTVVQKIYPIATYSYLATLPIIFLVTDLCRYKPIIILEGLAFVACFILLIWGNGLNALRVVEILYGLSSSTEVAYYTYIYAKVEKQHFKKVTSYTYTAILLGNFGAASLSQFFISSKWLDYRGLHYLTLASVSVALVISVFLPSVKKSLYFHQIEGLGQGETTEGEGSSVTKMPLVRKLKIAFGMLWKDFKMAYSNPYVVKWSIWWAIATAGFLQIISYIQPMYEEIAAYTDTDIYNGAVDAVHTLLSALLAILVGHVTIPWRKWGELLLCIISLVQGALLLWISRTDTILIAYTSYIIFRTLYQVMITVASSEVAQGISENSYGLIFGINRFLALSLQSILTFAVADEGGFALGERDQFLVYGSYFIALGVIFAAVVGFSLVKTFCVDKGEIPKTDRGNLEQDIPSTNSVTS